jgi:hypothetical protein
MNAQIGRILILIGVLLIVLGILFLFMTNKPSLLSWFGRLPGDIRIVRENTRIFIPITTMVLLSLAVTLIINLIKKLF